MSYRDPHAMLECLFYVNELPGGEAHHDGGMKGRDQARGARQPDAAADGRGTGGPRALRQQPKRMWSTKARPKSGSPNLLLSPADVAGDRVARHRQVGHGPRRFGSGVRRDREEVSRRSASSCRAISIRRRISARPRRSCRPDTRSR